MKKILSTLLTLVLFSAAALSGHAQAGFKLLTVDMGTLYDNYYETLGFQVKQAAVQQQAQADFDVLNKQGSVLVDEYKTLAQLANQEASTPEEKAKREAAAQEKYQQILKKQDEVANYKKSRIAALAEHAADFKKDALDKIRTAAADIAKAKGATALVDLAGPSMFGISNFLYTDPAADITAEVLQKINAGHPAKSASP